MWFKSKRWYMCKGKKKERKKCHLYWRLAVHKFQCPWFKPMPFCGYYVWLWSGSCVALQPAVCWYFPPTRNSGSPWHSSADTAAYPEPPCSVQLVLLWSWIHPCISAIKIKPQKIKKIKITTQFANTFITKSQQKHKISAEF